MARTALTVRAEVDGMTPSEWICTVLLVVMAIAVATAKPDDDLFS
jgi:hypothetical protein